MPAAKRARRRSSGQKRRMKPASGGAPVKEDEGDGDGDVDKTTGGVAEGKGDGGADGVGVGDVLGVGVMVCAGVGVTGVTVPRGEGVLSGWDGVGVGLGVGGGVGVGIGVGVGGGLCVTVVLQASAQRVA